jgi:hypothetical protein
MMMMIKMMMTMMTGTTTTTMTATTMMMMMMTMHFASLQLFLSNLHLVSVLFVCRFTESDIQVVQQCFRYTATVLTSTLAFQNERKLKNQTQACCIVCVCVCACVHVHFLFILMSKVGRIAKLVKTLDYRPKGTGFDPRLNHKRHLTRATDIFFYV